MAQIDVLASAIARRISAQLPLASAVPRPLESVATARPLWSRAARRMDSVVTRRLESVATRRFDSVLGPTAPAIDVEALASAVLRRLRGGEGR